MIFDKIIALTKQLYPTGRAFKTFAGSVKEGLYRGLALSEDRAYQDALSILDKILPDNDNFTAEDAADWERRLGLITNENLDLQVRKDALLRKINHPGTIRARQHYLYLERQLRLADFDVYVFENRFDDGMGGLITKTPNEILTVFNVQHGDFQHGDEQHGGGSVPFLESPQHGDFQHGDTQHGGTFTNLIANYIDESTDFSFNVGDNLRSTFFISGQPLGTFANVPESRKDEFRQLILKTKPAQTVGYLFINYI